MTYIGCHILNRLIACIVFADDMSLLAPTRGALQQLLDICIKYCEKFCLNFNVKKKHKIMFFGRSCSQIRLLANLKLGNADIDYVSNLRYLGFNPNCHGLENVQTAMGGGIFCL